MKKINALQLRQSLNKVILMLQKTHEPVLLEKGKKPAAVIISIDDFQKRFVEKAADEKRREIQKQIAAMSTTSKLQLSSEDILRQIRNGEEDYK